MRIHPVNCGEFQGRLETIVLEDILFPGHVPVLTSITSHLKMQWLNVLEIDDKRPPFCSKEQPIENGMREFFVTETS